MKLSAWAKANGLSYQTAWPRWRNGRWPIPVEQLATGTIIIHPPKEPEDGAVALDARVSSVDEKPDLERQLGRLSGYALRRCLGKLRRLSRSLNRKLKFSANWRKAADRLARLHARIANLRRDALHKATTGIVRKFTLIGIEELNLCGMLANHKLGVQMDICKTNAGRA